MFGLVQFWVPVGTNWKCGYILLEYVISHNHQLTANQVGMQASIFFTFYLQKYTKIRIVPELEFVTEFVPEIVHGFVSEPEIEIRHTFLFILFHGLKWVGFCNIVKSVEIKRLIGRFCLKNAFLTLWKSQFKRISIFGSGTNPCMNSGRNSDTNSGSGTKF